jgi:HK97 gp10 family phage protein
MSRQLRPKAKQIVKVAAEQVAGKMRELIENSPASGAVYHGHRASAPGEPPASDTGALLASIRVEQTGPLEATAMVGTPYAAYLEYGTVKMAPRPYATPAIESIRAKWGQRMRILYE